MIDPQIQVGYHAVFDGHGGAECALFCKKNLHKELVKAFTRSEEGRKSLMEEDDLNAALTATIREAFSENDLKFKEKFPAQSKQCGSTAVVCLLIGNKVVCANLGDARAVLCRNGKAVDLSVDYKASRKDEQERIKSQGGYIVFGRVLGRLAVTRAFGDFECK